MKVLATDLDMTLLHNGIAPYDGSMPLLRELVKSHTISLIFVTARRVDAVINSVLERYAPPEAAYIVGAIGAEIYERNSAGNYKELTEWRDYIRKETPLWNLFTIRSFIGREFPQLKLQPEKEQAPFKLSYYLYECSLFDSVKMSLEQRMTALFGDSVLVTCSKDLGAGIAYVDVTPPVVSKISALSFLLKRASIPQECVLFGGDSENDMSVFLSSLDSVVVANAEPGLINHIKREKLEGKLFVAKGIGRLNGNYSSGLIEGMIRKGWIPLEECSVFTSENSTFGS